MGRHGTPNITNRIDDVHVEWEPFDMERQNVMLLQTENGGIHNVNHFKQKYGGNACDFWYNTLGLDMMQTVCSNGIEP